MFRVRRECWFVFLVLAALAMLPAPAVEAREHKLVVEVQEPFEVNGEVYPAGELAVREVTDLNPVVTLNEVWIDGERIGLWPARETSPRVRVEHDQFIFVRAAEGHLVLRGIALEGETAHDLDWLQGKSANVRLERNSRPTSEKALTVASSRTKRP